jgi:hypothetical protein
MDRAITPPLARRRRGTPARHPLRTWLGRLVDVLGIVLMALVAVALVGATIKHFAQSASAPVVVIRMEPAIWPAGKGHQSGQAITYEFTVDGKTFRDTENRTWVNVAAARPKVCYDLSNPGGSHFLAQDAYTCAGWNPFQDYGQFYWSRDGT